MSGFKFSVYTSILAETDQRVSNFKEAVADLKQSIELWLTERQNADLKEAIEALLHSWEEIRRQQGADLSKAEKTYHFLQIADNAKMARDVLIEIEARATGLAETQTQFAFNRLSIVGSLLIAANGIGCLISSSGSVSIFRSLKATQATNANLTIANKSLERSQTWLARRSEQLVEAQHLGKLGDWSYRLGESEVLWGIETYKLLGYDPATFCPTPDTVKSIVAQDAANQLLTAQAEVIRTGGVKTVDVQGKRGDGSVGHFAVTIKALPDDKDQIVGFSGTVQDISERKRAEEQLEKLAYYDPLTGLANRPLFLRELNNVLTRRSQTGANGALLLLDLDRFKEVNDSLGHATSCSRRYRI